MINFDIISTIELTLSAAVVVMAVAGSFARASKERTIIASLLLLWLVAVIFAGATGLLGPRGFGTPRLGAAVVLPILILNVFTFFSAPGRASIRNAPLSALVGIHASRVLGSIVCVALPGRAIASALRARGGMG